MSSLTVVCAGILSLFEGTNIDWSNLLSDSFRSVDFVSFCCTAAFSLNMLVKGFLKLKVRLNNLDLLGVFLGFLSLLGIRSLFEERLLL